MRSIFVRSLVVCAPLLAGFAFVSPSQALTRVDRSVKVFGVAAPVARVATREIVIDCSDPLVFEPIIARYALTPVSSKDSIWVLRAASIKAAERAEKQIAKIPGVAGVWNNSILNYAKDFVPNDPFYNLNNPASGWPGQWYLNDTTATNADINAPAAWSTLLTGSGVFVGIADDGFELTHPDLSANYFPSGSTNLGTGGINTSNPSPVTAIDTHGTAITGLICGRGGNGVGITGVAPQASWSGIRIDFPTTAAQVLSAMQHRSLIANRLFDVKVHAYGPVAPWDNGSAEVTQNVAVNAAGVIAVRSAGNLRNTTAEDANKSSVRNTPDAILVTAVNSLLKFTQYGNFGSCVFVSAPSAEFGTGTRSIITTDRTGADGFNAASLTDGDTFPDAGYTSIFGTDFDGGTSAATGLVAGVMALGKDARPDLNLDLARHMIARTARQIDTGDVSVTSDGGWKTNAAGFKTNQNYGFGLIDAGAFLTELAKWKGVEPIANTTVATTAVGTAIPDNNTTGLNRTFVVSQTRRLESVQVTLNLTHTFAGDIEAYLTAPSGTRSRLILSNGADAAANIAYTFTSHAFWGENPAGTWTINVRDVFASSTGTWTNFSALLQHGELFREVLVTPDFDAWQGGNLPVTVELRDPSTSTLVKSFGATQADLTELVGNLTTSGIYDVFVSSPYFLRKKISAISVTSASTQLGTVILINGDVDQDGEVGPGDFELVVSNFGNSPATQADGDMDGDGEVGPGDFEIVVANFGLSGD
jgi:subtilisin-like proprotein convertase family protein